MMFFSHCIHLKDNVNTAVYFIVYLSHITHVKECVSHDACGAGSLRPIPKRDHCDDVTTCTCIIDREIIFFPLRRLWLMLLLYPIFTLIIWHLWHVCCSPKELQENCRQQFVNLLTFKKNASKCLVWFVFFVFFLLLPCSNNKDIPLQQTHLQFNSEKTTCFCYSLHP